MASVLSQDTRIFITTEAVMRNFTLALTLTLGVITLAFSAEADCTCDSKCTLTCINNFDGMSDTSLPPKLDGEKCVPDSPEASLDEICKAKGFKGVAPHDKNHEDKPPLWCDTPTCR